MSLCSACSSRTSIATVRHLGLAGNAIGPFGAQALLLALGVDGVGGASGRGDPENDEADSDEEGAHDQNVGKRGRGSNSSSTNGRSANSNISSSSTRSSVCGVGGQGKRAWRTIDMAHCCLARKASDDGPKDRASNASAFNPTAPNGDYT